MTQAALDHANPVVLTSDNPRTENPEQIFADMKHGVDFDGHQIDEIHDRREAIKFVVKQAQAGDIVVIAGKGHENYQRPTSNASRHACRWSSGGSKSRIGTTNARRRRQGRSRRANTVSFLPHSPRLGGVRVGRPFAERYGHRVCLRLAAGLRWQWARVAMI